MGVWGWDEIRDYVRVEGTVYGPQLGANADWYPHRYKGTLNDWDWLVFIRPDPGFSYVLKNPLGEVNHNGLIECEVQPKRRLPNGEDSRDWAVVQRYFAPLRDQHVIAIGTWSRDRSHSAADNDLPDPSDGDHGKMELHPLSALLREVPMPAFTGIRRFVLLAMSDDANSDPLRVSNKVPHSGAARLISLQVPVPDGSIARKVDEVSDAASASCSIVRAPVGPSGAMTTAIQFSVNTGRPRRWLQPLGRDHGFYYGVWDAYAPAQAWPRMNLSYTPDPVPVDVTVPLLVTAADDRTGADLPGSAVFLDGVPAGVTGTPFSHRFTSKLENRVVIGAGGKPIQFQIRVPPNVALEVHSDQHTAARVPLRFVMPNP